MAVPLVAVSVVTVPVTSWATAVVVVALVATMPIIMVPRIMPLPFIVVVLFPATTLPIAMAIVVPVPIPTRSNDNGGRWLNVHRRRRSVDRLGNLPRLRPLQNHTIHISLLELALFLHAGLTPLSPNRNVRMNQKGFLINKVPNTLSLNHLPDQKHMAHPLVFNDRAPEFRWVIALHAAVGPLLSIT